MFPSVIILMLQEDNNCLQQPLALPSAFLLISSSTAQGGLWVDSPKPNI